MLARYKTIVTQATLSSCTWVLLVYLVFLAASTPGWLNPALFCLGLAFWLVASRAHTGLELPAGGFLLVLALASGLSYDPRRSFEQVWSLASGFLVLFIAAGISVWPAQRARLVFFLLLLGGAAMAWSWWDASGWFQAWRAAEPERWFPTVNFRLNGSNNLAAYYNMLLMPAAAFWLWGQGKWRRVFLGIYILSAVLLIFLTSSRGGWVGTAAGLALLGMVVLWRNWQKKAASGEAFTGRFSSPGWISSVVKVLLSNRLDWRVWVGAGAVTALLAGLAWIYLAAMSSHPTHGSFLISRSEFWPPAWQAFLQSPLWGQGLNVYASFHMRWYSYPPQLIFLHAHNQYLDVLMGAGLLGASAFLWLMVALARRLIITLKNGLLTTPQELPLAAGVAAALMAYLVHGIFDGLYRMPFASLTLVVLLGSGLSRPQPLSRGIKGLCVLVWGTLAVYGLWGAWRSTPLYQAVEFANRENLESAPIGGSAAEDISNHLDEAARRDPANAAVHQQRGIFYSLMAEQGQPGALEEALQSFERAAVLDPTWGLNYANLGALYRAAGRLDRAEEEFRRAAEVAPKAPLYWLNYAEVLESQGKSSKARQAFEKVLEFQPDNYPAEYWRKRTTLAQPPTPAPDETSEQLLAKGLLWKIDYARLAQAYLREGQVDQAGYTIQKGALAYPYSQAEQVELNWQRADWYAAQGDLKQALGWGERALDGLRRQGAYGAGSFARVEYAQQVFGSPALAPDLVPQLSLLPLSDVWVKRWERLAGWYSANGQPETARQRQEEARRLSRVDSR